MAPERDLRNVSERNALSPMGLDCYSDTPVLATAPICTAEPNDEQDCVYFFDADRDAELGVGD